MLFQNTSFKPSFPKFKIFKHSLLNFQASNQFCTKFKEFANLVGQTENHTQ